MSKKSAIRRRGDIAGPDAQLDVGAAGAVDRRGQQRGPVQHRPDAVTHECSRWCEPERPVQGQVAVGASKLLAREPRSRNSTRTPANTHLVITTVTVLARPGA